MSNRTFSGSWGHLPVQIENPAFQRDDTPMMHKVGGPCVPVAKPGLTSWAGTFHSRIDMPPPFCPVCMGGEAP